MLAVVEVVGKMAHPASCPAPVAVVVVVQTKMQARLRATLTRAAAVVVRVVKLLGLRVALAS